MVKKIAKNRYLAKHFLGIRYYIIHDENSKSFYTAKDAPQRLFLQDCLLIALMKKDKYIKPSMTEIFYNRVNYTDFEGMAEALHSRLKSKGLLESVLPLLFLTHLFIFFLMGLYKDCIIICCSLYLFRNYRYLSEGLLMGLQSVLYLASPWSSIFIISALIYTSGLFGR